jgi:cobalt-precorrin-5B (C1)-methyltransferase
VTGPELREPGLPRTAKVRTGPLRSGWTTGTCSAAAAKAATTALVSQTVQTAVEVVLPDARVVPFAVERCEVGPSRAEAVVVKDAGDDPDVTHGAHLTATVRWSDAPGVHLEGGVGVGVVTKPGLGLEVGGPAINPVPRQMIRDNVGTVVDLAVRGVDVVISVPDGELRARKTTNARLGILGGISILGSCWPPAAGPRRPRCACCPTCPRSASSRSATSRARRCGRRSTTACATWSSSAWPASSPSWRAASS